MHTNRAPHDCARTGPAYVTIEEAAELMAMSTVTVRRRISGPSIPAYTCGRRPIRIRVEDIDAAMHRIPSAGT